MGNRQFAIFIFLVLAVFFGWIAYDSSRDTKEIAHEQYSGDVILGPSDSMAAIQYIFHFPDPVYFHDRTTAQIEQISGGVAETAHYHVYGITEADYKMDALYQFNWSKKWFKDDYSIWVENLQVDFSYNTLDVYVTSAYPEDSCEYRETLAHENQHVEIHRQVYLDYQKILRDALSQAKNIPLSDRPLDVSNVERGKAEIGKLISGIVDPVFDDFKQTLTEKQAELDTPENYAELRSRCPGW